MNRRAKRAAPPGARERRGTSRSVPVNAPWNKALFLLALLGVMGVIAVWLRPGKSALKDGYVRRPQGTLTFAKDIAPIVFNHCAVCHHAGQSAPFSLVSYPEVKKHAREIVEVTGRRYMPPWLPAPGCGEFADERRLSADQIGIIRQWVEEGAVEGNPADAPPVPQWNEGWQLGPPHLVIQMPRPYLLRPEGKDVYRNFVIPIPTTSKRYVRAVEFLPDNPKVVHHAFIKVDRTRQSRRLEERNQEPGFDFMITPVSAQMPEGHFLSWVPGNVPTREAEGLAWTLETNTDLVLQLHLRPSGKPETVQPTVGFYFTETPPTNTPFKVLLTSRVIDIPAGCRDYLVSDAFQLPVDVELLAVLPHAHYLGREMEGLATLPDGTKKWLLRIKEWDFNWQGDYRYARPVYLPRGTTVSMRYTYDNSTNNVRNPHQPPQRVSYGPQTTDEMAELWLQVLPRTRGDFHALAKAFQAKMRQVFLARNSYLLERNPNDPEAHNAMGTSMLALGRTTEAIQHFRVALELRPDYEDPHFYLGYLYRQQKKLAAARDEYEKVLRINPDNSEAHGNLGLIYTELGSLDRAVSHFQDALRLNPDDTVARDNLALVLQALQRR